MKALILAALQKLGVKGAKSVDDNFRWSTTDLATDLAAEIPMVYLFIPGPDLNDGKPWHSPRGPAPGHVESILDGELEVFRLNGTVYEQLIPIEREDTYSWNIVEDDNGEVSG